VSPLLLREIKLRRVTSQGDRSCWRKQANSFPIPNGSLCRDCVRYGDFSPVIQLNSDSKTSSTAEIYCLKLQKIQGRRRGTATNANGYIVRTARKRVLPSATRS
jgi:hypothetical protein